MDERSIFALRSRIGPDLFRGAPELSKIAYFSAAIALWYHANIPVQMSGIRKHRSQDSAVWSSLCRKVRGYALDLMIPNSICQRLQVYVDKIKYELEDWVTYHSRAVFFGQQNDLKIYKFIYHIIWYPDGNINYAKTAANLLKSKSTSTTEKFFLSCLYCLEDEIRAIAPSVIERIDLTQLRFNEHPLIHYWICCLRSALNNIQVTRDLSIECFMVQQHYVNNWSAVEYFFDRMNSDEQVQSAIWLIDKYGLMYQEVLLMKLNEIQRLSLYSSRCTEILYNYSRSFNTTDISKNVLVTWFEIRNTISREQFALIFRELLWSRVVDTVMTDIWTSACADFKRHVLKNVDNEFISTLFYRFGTNYDSDFIFTVLADMNANAKQTMIEKRFFTQCCENLICEQKPSILDRLLNQFFPTTEESAQFKRNLVSTSDKVKSQCFEYFRDYKKIKIAHEMLALALSPDYDFVLEYKRKILMSPEGTRNCSFLMGSVKRGTLCNLIADCFNTESLAWEFKKEVIYSTWGIRKLQEMILEDNLRTAKKYINWFLESNEEKKLFKRRLLIDNESVSSTMIQILLR
ncbi:uncharacterized protein LOC135843655 [Planococcus citri]|uniref:uncharacterized protein LOC135843655 n=1 Tax=Planococcus citri TaxID=170843 RepID=UPI0031F8C703